MNKRILAVVAFGAMAAFALSGCSSGGSGNTATTGSGGGATSPSGEKITLTVAAYIGGTQEPGGLPDLIKKYQDENPNVTIDFAFQTSSDYDTYMNPRLAAGTAPDVFMTDKVHMNRWAPQGYLADLSDQPWVSRFNDNLGPYTSIGGKTYQFLAQNIPLGLYANLDLLKSVGIDEVPTDWPTFVADLQILKDAGKNGLMLPGGSNGWNAEMNALSLASNLLPASWAEGYDAGSSTWNPTWAPVVEHLEELFQKGYVDGTAMGGIDPFSQGVQQFTGGDWAFYVDGAWDLSHFKSEATFAFSLNAYPGGEAGTEPQAVTYLGAGWGVNAKAKYPDEAKKFVNFLTQPENYSVFLTAEACFSTLKDVDSPSVDEAAPFAAAFKDGRTRPDDVHTLNDPNAEANMQKAFVTLFTDASASPSDILGQMDTDIPRTPVEGK